MGQMLLVTLNPISDRGGGSRKYQCFQHTRNGTARTDAMQRAGREYPQIWHLFAFLPEATGHLARFTQEIMRGPAPLSPGLRELIAAFTSQGNDCPF